MKRRTTSSLVRSAALIGAIATAGTAFGVKDQVWSGGASGNWNGENVWTDGTLETGNYVVNDSTQDVTINFPESLTAGYEDGDTSVMTGVWIENGGAYTVTFAAPDDPSHGLEMDTLHVGTGTGAGKLKLASGVYVSYNDVTMSNGGTGILTLEGGTLTCGTAATEKWFLLGDATTQGSFDSTVNLNAGGVLEVWHFQRYTTGGDCTINFNGGTLRALGESWSNTLVGEAWPDSYDRKATIVVGANGGTIDTNGKNIAITAPVTGTGTLTVTGGGTLTFSSTPTCLVVAGDANTTVVLPEARAAVVDLDFEDASTYTSGWTLGGNGGYSQGERTLADGTTSKFLRVWTGTGSGNRQYTASYTLPSEITSATEYTLEFDWFAAQNATYDSSSLDMGLYVYAGSDVKLKIISNPVTLSGDKAQIYLDGSETPLETTIDTAPAKMYSNGASADCTGTTNQDKWYHVVFRANATDGLMLKILNYQGTEVLAETKVSDFANISRIYLDMNKRRSNFEAFGGLDDIVGTVSAVATINGTGYATLAAAGVAASSGDTIILTDDIVLTSSATITWGATVALAGHTLTTTTEGVEVLFDNGTHRLASTTEDGTTTFTEEIVAASGAFIWTGEGTADENGYYAWSDTENWQGGAAPALATDNVYIGAGDAVTITGNGDVTGVLYIERDVTITGSWTLATVNGTGTLKMDGVAITGTGDFTVNCDLDTANSVYSASGSLTLNGALKGTGTITHYSNSSGSPSGGFQFYGDTSAFAGSYYGCTRASNTRDRTKFYSPAFGSANAYWQFGFEGSSGGDRSHAFQSSGEYHFGTLDSQALKVLDATGVTLVIGERAGTSTLTVDGGLRNAANKIVKANPAEGTSTLNLILTAASDGTIEAEAGVLNMNGSYAPTSLTITGTDATVVVASTCGTTTTETVVVTEAVEDDPETEEDETQAEVTQEVSTFTALVPVLSSDLAAAYYQLKSVAGESATTYTVADVAQDASGNTYKTIGDALDAVADAENKTITVIFDTTEPVVLPAVGYTLDTDGHTTGTVSGATGVGVTVSEGVYTSIDNTSATWQGDAAGANWADAANWSTGAIPDESTAVSFTYNALVYISDHDNLAHKCASMDISDGVTVEFAPPNKDYTIYPRVAVYGNINGGKGTLKLWRSGIYNATDGYVAVYPAVTFENPGVVDGQTRDSWFQGSYTFHGDVTGTGVLVLYAACTFDTADINVPEGSVIDFRANPTLSHATETLTGAGTVIVHATPANGSRWKNALQNSTNWQGVTEVQGSYTNIDAANFGGSGSTVRFNGVTGYLRYSDGSTVEVGNVKTIDIGANGLTLNNGFSSGTGKNYIISAAVTGSGTIAFGTKHAETAKAKYIFTGDVSGFTGAINYGSLASYRACVYFASGITSSAVDTLTAPTDYGQIIVEEGNTVDVAATWYGAGGWLINGTVNVASTGSLTCDSNGAKIGGSGTINYAAIPANTTALTYNADAWTGTVVLPATTISTKTGIPLAGLSSANGTLVINGITRSTTSNSIYLGTGASCTIAGTTQLDGDLHITDGNSNATYTWNKITGTGDILFTTAGGSASGITNAITRLDGYSGTIDVGGNATLTLGTIAVDTVEVGTPLVKLSSTCVMADAAVAAVAVEAGGTALANASVVKESDGLYLAVASVDVTTTPDEGEAVTTTTKFATYEAAAAFADSNSVTEFTVLYGDGAVNGWDYDSENAKLTKNTTAIARIGATQYDTLAAAFEAATAGDTVVLFGASAEAAALAADGATLEIDTTATYTGTISGDGTVVADAAFTPVFGEWTGTFVVNWAIVGGSNGTAFKPTIYGNANSIVKLAKGASDIYLTDASGSYGDIGTKLYFGGNVSFRNGWGGEGQASTIPQLGADEGVVVTTRQGASTSNATYLNITVLKDFAGSFVVNSGTVTTIGGVALEEIPEFGTKVVSATIASGATAYSIGGKIAEGYPLVFEDDGLYFDPVAQVGEAYYNTLVEAITAANGATVALVKSTEEDVVVAAGQTVVIQFGDFSTGTIAAATDYILNTIWDDATKTGTYTTTAVAAYLTVGETVTPYTVAYTALTDFMASAAGSTLRFVGTNPYADTAVPCASYDAETLTYTKLAAVAQIGTGVSVIQYSTLAAACAAAEEYSYDTVTLLVALGEQTVPEGWDYNDPETSGTEFGTLTKEVTVTYNVWFVDTDGSTVLSPMQTVESGSTATEPEDPTKEGKVFVAWTLGGTVYNFATPVTATITLMASWEDAPTGTDASDGNGNTFTVPATVATPAGKTLTDAATGSITYAQAYALGLWDGTAEGTVAEPEVTIAIVNGKVQVAFAGGTVPEAYTVSCQLQSKTDLAGIWANVESATGNLGSTLTDSSTMGAKNFYRVLVTIQNAQ